MLLHAAIKDLLQKYHITKMVAVPEILSLMEQRIRSYDRERGIERFFNY